VGTVDCLDNLHRDVQEGVRACIRNSGTILRPECKVGHPQLHLTLMRPYRRTRKEWIACLVTGVRQMSRHLSTQPISINKSKPAKGFAMWQKGSAARVRDEAAVLLPKKIKNQSLSGGLFVYQVRLILSFWGPKSCNLELLCK